MSQRQNAKPELGKIVKISYLIDQRRKFASGAPRGRKVDQFVEGREKRSVTLGATGSDLQE